MKMISKKIQFQLFLIPAVGLLMVAISVAQSGEDTWFMQHLRYLSSDALKGRGNGSEELEHAAEYIAEHFREAGLLPAGEGDTYFQKFELVLGQRVDAKSQMTYRSGNTLIQLKPGEDYIPLTADNQKEVKGQPVFVGSGITAPALGHDDYKDLDVEGKIALILEHDSQGIVEGINLTHYSTTVYKIMNARSRGAIGVILLPDYSNPPKRISSSSGEIQIAHVGIHAVRLTEKGSSQLFGDGGHDLDKAAGLIDSRFLPKRFSPEYEVTINMHMARVPHTVRNVLGFIKGETDKIIVLGAHYDHLGTGTQGSLGSHLRGEIHNGADDNASGTAGLLQLAKKFSQTTPHRGLLFIAFAGEELGLLGSKHYTQYPTMALQNTIAMLNLDMIGRSDGDIFIGGTDTSNKFRMLLESVQESSVLKFSYSDNLRGSSDHLSFASKKIPVLFFFSGLHNDYHRPSDDWERINVDATREVIDVVYKTVDRLSNLQTPLEYLETHPESSRARSMERTSKPRFGAIVDTSWGLEGVRFEEILEGSSAAVAGLRNGDVLLSFEGNKIQSFGEFTDALVKKVPGDEVEVVVLRGERRIRTAIFLAGW